MENVSPHTKSVPLLAPYCRNKTRMQKFRARLSRDQRLKYTPKVEKYQKETFRSLVNLEKPHYMKYQSPRSPISPIMVGDAAKTSYYDTYKNIRKINERSNFYDLQLSPQAAYVNSLEKNFLSPRPMGICRRKGSEEDINLRLYRIGDNYAEALSQSVRQMPSVRKLNLASNRMSKKGSNSILKSLNPEGLRKIDLSDNQVDAKSIQILLKIIYSRQGCLKTLNLEKTNIGNLGTIQLFQNLIGNQTIESINLAYNNLDDIVGKPIGEALESNSALKRLDLHYNTINKSGAEELFSCISDNTKLQELDMSFNALWKDNFVVQKISQWFATNTALRHVDLSQNSFNSTQIQIIAEGLKENHTILGIHMIGNECEVDSKGFVQPLDRPQSVRNCHIITRVINSPKALKKTRTFNNCWLCERWHAIKFVWQPTEQGKVDPIYLHLECDDYRPEMMIKSGTGDFEITRVVPKGKWQFFFSHEGKPLLADRYKTKSLGAPLKKTIQFDEVTSEEMKIFTVNWLDSTKGPECNMKIPFESEPRHSSLVWLRPENVRAKTPWTIPISLFKDYKFDSDQLFAKCFEYDWSCSKIPRVVKKEDELAQVKEVLRGQYKFIRESYKYYAAVGAQGGVFCVGTNAFTDFCSQCQLVDNVTFKLSDVDFNLAATTYNVVKNNPRNPGNALVRFEFMEILVRIAMDKFYKTKTWATPAEAVKRLMQDMMPYMETIDSNKWRWDKYICEDVDLVLKSYKRILDGIYDKYSGRYTKPGAKNFMSLEEFEDICMDGGFINETLVQREIDISFNLAMMTQVDELNQNRHAEMTWVEFIEALSRVADQANVPTPKAGEDNQVDVNENAANLPLAQKLENMMPKLLQLCSAYLQENFNFPSTSPFYGIKKAIKRTTVSSVILSPKSSTDLEGPQGLNMTRSSQKDKGSTLGSVAGSPRKSIIEEQASIPFIQGMNPSVS